MPPVLWAATALLGFAVAVWASRKVVAEASAVAFGSRAPPFLVGLTLLALGTDLPEIANSVITSAADHGDLNVGDSLGSVATQSTLVLGLVILLAGVSRPNRRVIVLAGSVSVAALGFAAVVVADGRLSRLDGLILIAAWVGLSLLLWRLLPPGSDTAVTPPQRERRWHALAALGYLIPVGLGASVAVVGLTELAVALALPEMLMGFFGAALGTSLPELMVAITAIRRGSAEIAFGDVFGACLADATLSLAAGPVLFPVAVSGTLGLKGAGAAAAALILATGLLALIRRRTWPIGLALLGAYAGLYFVL